MEKKSYHNLERTRLANLMVGFCYISGIVLATFSYGRNEEIEKRYRTTSFDNSNFYAEVKEKPKELEKQVETPKQSTQNNTVIDLNNDIKPNDKLNTTVEEKPFVDLGLSKGDTTVIVNNEPLPVILPDKIVEFPDVEAEFPGGYDEWKKYLLNELVYPEFSIENGEQGVVYLSFVVESDGSIGDVKVVKGVSIFIDREAKRVIKNSPKWRPAKTLNQSVRTRMIIPINFVIN